LLKLWTPSPHSSSSDGFISLLSSNQNNFSFRKSFEPSKYAR
jgi:hypothetical protein